MRKLYDVSFILDMLAKVEPVLTLREWAKAEACAELNGIVLKVPWEKAPDQVALHPGKRKGLEGPGHVQ
jgi:hypothetical protein